MKQPDWFMVQHPHPHHPWSSTSLHPQRPVGSGSGDYSRMPGWPRHPSENLPLQTRQT